MKRAIEILSTPEGYVPFELEVREPGIVRAVVTGFQAPSIVAPADGAKPPEMLMRPTASLMFEVDPEQGTRLRKYIWLLAGKAVSYPGKLTFRATYVDETTGMPMILYEAHGK